MALASACSFLARNSLNGALSFSSVSARSASPAVIGNAFSRVSAILFLVLAFVICLR